MSLSGRQLNPLIYGSILSALGVSPAVLADLASPDPATQHRTRSPRSSPHCLKNRMARSMLRSPWVRSLAYLALPAMPPSMYRPNCSLRSCCSRDSISPRSHLVSIEDEHIDYGDPAITAAQVVDRETLKAFVTQAGNYMLDVQRAGDPRAASRARIALRDPNGPWRHGSVYLYVLDTVSNIITFHAAFPDRFENRPLVPSDPRRRDRRVHSAAGRRCGEEQPGRRLHTVLLRRSRRPQRQRRRPQGGLRPRVLRPSPWAGRTASHGRLHRRLGLLSELTAGGCRASELGRQDRAAPSDAGHDRQHRRCRLEPHGAGDLRRTRSLRQA